MNSESRQPIPARYPRATIRLRTGRKMLRHGLALGWRTQWDGPEFPVTVTTIKTSKPEGAPHEHR